MLKRLRRLLPHAAILICNMYVVLYLIDRVNTAMNFIDNRLTKGLMLILCVVSWFNCQTLMRAANAPRRPAQMPPERRSTQARQPARDTYGGYGAQRPRDGYAPRYGTSSYRSGGERRPASSASGYSDRRPYSSDGRYAPRRSSVSTSRYGEGRYR